MLDIFAKRFSPKERAFFKFLRTNKLFESLTDEELSEFQPYFHLRKYEQNEVVFFRNDPSQALYLIRNGRVLLNIDIQDKFENLSSLSDGMSFGDDALLPNTLRNYNAICISEPCEIYVLPQVSIFDIFSDVEIKTKMMEAYASECEQYLSAIFKMYRETFGFFDLGQAYTSAQKNWESGFKT
jgi:CRP/FNR family transcriptional regulator, cyclic AMP receptor protein